MRAPGRRAISAPSTQAAAMPSRESLRLRTLTNARQAGRYPPPREALRACRHQRQRAPETNPHSHSYRRRQRHLSLDHCFPPPARLSGAVRPDRIGLVPKSGPKLTPREPAPGLHVGSALLPRALGTRLHPSALPADRPATLSHPHHIAITCDQPASCEEKHF